MHPNEWNAFWIVGTEKIFAGHRSMRDQFGNKLPTFSTPETKYFIHAIGEMDYSDDQYESAPVPLPKLKSIIDYLKGKQFCDESFRFDEFVEFLDSVHSFCTRTGSETVIFILLINQ